MKVLVIDEWLPWPLESGKKIRSYNLISRLAKRHEIVYMGYVDIPSETPKIKEMEKAGLQVVPVEDRRGRKWTLPYYSRVLMNLFSNKPFSTVYHIRKEFSRELSSVLDRFRPDLVHCEWTNLAPFLECVGPVPSVISAHNIESMIWDRWAENCENPLKRLVASRQARRIERLERDWYSRVKHCIAVSENDRRVIESYGGNATVVENGVDVALYRRFQPDSPPDQNQIHFVASFDTFANQDGFEYFVNEIFPKILYRKPEASFFAVGKSPTAAMRALARQHRSVCITGSVPDVRSFIASSAISVVPLRIGGGSRLKILEAMAMGKPVVSTTVGAEGLQVEHGKNIILADSPEQFAKEILDLLGNRERRESLSREGLRLVESTYDWDILVDGQERVWRASANK